MPECSKQKGFKENKVDERNMSAIELKLINRRDMSKCIQDMQSFKKLI